MAGAERTHSIVIFHQSSNLTMLQLGEQRYIPARYCYQDMLDH